MKKSYLMSLLFISFFCLISLFSSRVLAVGASNRAGNHPQNVAAPNIRLSVSPGAEGRLKSCQERENALKIRSEQLTKMATNMLEKFDSITERVKDYYTTKVLSSGKSVANYNDLVADINNKKAAVQTGLAKAQNDLAAFNCDNINPKGQMSQFRTDMQLVKQALKAYRTAIKNLIVAVHSVTGAENSTNPSRSPRPTRLPNAKSNRP